MEDEERLVTLDAAASLIGGDVSPRKLIRLIAAGKLPAAKVGRGYLVDPRDVRALFTPKLRLPRAERERRSPKEREREQLAAAGIVVT
jgi:excisionase family DNA binding protein